ncbi:MAG TPA: GDP-mannose 4,6-dehydratase [Promineifilum sp.]|nr:GDP-mannose 4,6-dehydratase [Promineifilum sp.]
MSRPRVLVTGATGFVGRALLPHLVEQADVTLLLLEEFAGAALPAPLGQLRPALDVVYSDLRNYPLTARAVRQARPERVIHLAAAGVSDPFLDPRLALSHNVAGTLNLLRACFDGAAAIQQLIVARTSAELEPSNVYAASKAAAWAFGAMYARAAAWPIHGAMIFQAYGPGQPPGMLLPAALRAARAGQDFPMTAGQQEKDWIHVDDVAAGLLALLGRDLPPGATAELGTGQTTTVRAVVERLYALVGRGGRPLPGALPSRPGEAPRHAADAAATAALIGWRARVGLEEGLARLVEQE